jgi:hypothetical protein
VSRFCPPTHTLPKPQICNFHFGFQDVISVTIQSSPKTDYIPMNRISLVEHAVCDLLFQREGVRHKLPCHIVFLNVEQRNTWVRGVESEVKI